ncbi:MAG: hypothetical protein ACO1Q7_13720 [Gemmatimonas sp.]
MRIIHSLLSALVLGVSAAYLSACDSSTEPANTAPEIAGLRKSLAPFGSFKLAKEAGYTVPITDCMSNGDVGAMGVHWGNASYIDGVADSLHPEALIYEPGTNGEMTLVGVEFIIPFSVLPKTAPAPTLFGQKYMVNEIFQVWALHVWTHRANPNGTYAMWNPRVRC